MKWGTLLLLLLMAGGTVSAQSAEDSTFSLFFNCSVGFNHANDPHINHWLKEYGYPAEPRVPVSLNFEAAAMPANSRLLYSIHLSTVTNTHDLTAFNLGAGMFVAPIKTSRFMLFLGGSLGYHAEIITLNGNLPPAYDSLSVHYNALLALRRTGLSISPMMRIFWHPLRLGKVVELGITGGAGYALDLNSNWRLGYYTAEPGKYDHFRKLNKPSDQHKVSEHGISLNTGVSLRFNLH